MGDHAPTCTQARMNRKQQYVTFKVSEVSPPFTTFFTEDDDPDSIGQQGSHKPLLRNVKGLIWSRGVPFCTIKEDNEVSKVLPGVTITIQVSPTSSRRPISRVTR